MIMGLVTEPTFVDGDEPDLCADTLNPIMRDIEAVHQEMEDHKANHSNAIPENSITDIQIGDRTLSLAQPTGSTGKITELLSWIAKQIQNITGKAHWYDAPSTSLETLSSGKLDVGAKAVDSDKLDNMQPSTTNVGTTIVQRDASGNFAAGTIAANLTGNVTGNVTGSADQVDGHHAGAAAGNVPILDGNARVPTANLPILNVVAKNWDTVYQATEGDGFAVCTAQGNQTRTGIYVGDTNPPTPYFSDGCEGGTGSIHSAVCVPVKKNQYYKATGAGSERIFNFVYFA
jgi:hypothetical protein